MAKSNGADSSSTLPGGGTEGVVTIGSGSSAGILDFFLVNGFLAASAVEDEDAVTGIGEGRRAVGVGGDSYPKRIKKSIISQSEEVVHTCEASGGGITAAKSTTTVFFRFLVLLGCAGEGSEASIGSAAGSTGSSTGNESV